MMNEFDETEPSLSEQFVGRMVAVWCRHNLPEDELASAMLAHAVNALIDANDPHEVAGLLVGIAAQINPQTVGGNA